MNNEEFWADIEFIKWDKALFHSIYLTNIDIKVLTEEGLPEWVAPHLNFDHFVLESNRLKLGEDKEDRDIFICLDNFKILVGNNNQLINSSVSQLKESLKLYAIMIEKAISLTSDEFDDVIIPKNLISELETELVAIDCECVKNGSFWSEELTRLNQKIADTHLN